MWQCVCSCRDVSAAQRTCLNIGATCKIAHHPCTARNDAEIPLPRWHTVCRSVVIRHHAAIKKGLNRTIVVAELFGDSGIMHPKKRRWRERFQSTPKWMKPIGREKKKKKKKKAFCCSALDYCPSPHQGRWCYHRACMNVPKSCFIKYALTINQAFKMKHRFHQHFCALLKKTNKKNT